MWSEKHDTMKCFSETKLYIVHPLWWVTSGFHKQGANNAESFILYDGLPVDSTNKEPIMQKVSSFMMGYQWIPQTRSQ